MLSWQNRAGRRSSVSHAELQDWRARSRAFAGLAAFSDAADEHQRRSRAGPEQVRGSAAHGQRVRRAPAAAAPRPRFRVRRRAARAPNRSSSSATASGRTGTAPIRTCSAQTLRVNGQPATIVGVMPEGMKFPDNTELWVPFIPTDAQEQRNARPLSVFGRLRDGADRRDGAGGAERHRTAACGRIPGHEQGPRRRPRRNLHRTLRRRRRPASCSSR